MDISIIRKLENIDLVELGRAADLLWLSFGKPVIINTFKETKEVTEYALHIQCPRRFIKDNAIVLASSDIYEPNNSAYDNDPEWDWDEFDRDISKQNVFFVNSMKIRNYSLPLTIEKVIFNERGDIKIEFNKNIVFEVFINGSRKDEYWRFIDFNKNPSAHFVVFED